MLKGMIESKYAGDIAHANPDVTGSKMLPIIKELCRIIETETKEEFSFDHVLTLRASMVIPQGIEKTQCFDTDKVASALETATSIDSPYGKGRFAGKGLIGRNRLVCRQIPLSRTTTGGSVEFEFLPVR
jgi:hypothetical protein